MIDDQHDRKPGNDRPAPQTGALRESAIGDDHAALLYGFFLARTRDSHRAHELTAQTIATYAAADADFTLQESSKPAAPIAEVLLALAARQLTTPAARRVNSPWTRLCLEIDAQRASLGATPLKATAPDRHESLESEELDPAACEALDLHYRSGASLEQIASQLHRSPQVVQTLLDRARRVVRNQLTLHAPPTPTAQAAATAMQRRFERRRRRRATRRILTVALVLLLLGAPVAFRWLQPTANDAMQNRAPQIADANRPRRVAPISIPASNNDNEIRPAQSIPPAALEYPRPFVEPDQPVGAAAIVPLPIAAAKPIEQNAAIISKTVNDPDGVYEVGPLNNGQQLKLVGRVRTLRISLVDGRSTLDASALDAGEVIFTDKIDGHSTVRLRAAHGNVEFHGKIDGHSTVDVDAPGGVVKFIANAEQREPIKIDGDSQLRITAKDIDLRAPMNGTSTQVEVTVTDGGRIAFNRLEGGVQVRYQKAAVDAPAPAIIRGAVLANASFREGP